jgi:hypothetical protein
MVSNGIPAMIPTRIETISKEMNALIFNFSTMKRRIETAAITMTRR